MPKVFENIKLSGKYVLKVKNDWPAYLRHTVNQT